VSGGTRLGELQVYLRPRIQYFCFVGISSIETLDDML